MGSTHFQGTEQRLSEDKLVMGVATAPECWGELCGTRRSLSAAFPMPKPALSLLLVEFRLLLGIP